MHETGWHRLPVGPALRKVTALVFSMVTDRLDDFEDEDEAYVPALH